MRYNFHCLNVFHKELSMYKIRRILLSTLILGFLLGQLFSGGIRFYELGQPSSGCASAGMAASALDASTAYFNPAGMAFLKKSELMVGGQAIASYGRFRSNEHSTETGPDGGNFGGVSTGGAFYFVQKIFSRMALGLSVTRPFYMDLDYDDNWKGRYVVQEHKIESFDIAPELAVKVADFLYIGGGCDLYFLKKYDGWALRNFSPDGRLKLKFSGEALGWNLGALFKIKKGTRIGVSFRSKAKFFLFSIPEYINVETNLCGFSYDDFCLPNRFNISFYQEVSEKLSLLFDVGLDVWNKMGWKDTWRVGFGARYAVSEKITAKAGVSYDSNPISIDFRLPHFPLDRQLRLAAGIDYDLSKRSSISCNYVFIEQGSARLDYSGGDDKRVAGSYNQNSHVINVSLRYRWG